MHRWRADAFVGLGKFKVPFSVGLMLPSQPGRSLEFQKPNLKQYLLMPGNAIGIQPNFEKLKLQIFLGSHTSRYSPLSAGNIAFTTGLGFAFTPGKWQFRGSYGITARPIERDSIHNIVGQYERWMFAAMAGRGEEKKNHLFLHLVQVQDHTNDRLTSSRRPLSTPAEGLLFSTKLRIGLLKTFYVRSEVAASLFSVNREAVTFSEEIVGDYQQYIDKLAPYFKINTSTRLGGAADAEVGLQRENWNVGFGGKFLSAGFKSLAYFYQVTDQLDATSKLGLKLFKQKLILDGTGGLRLNNIQGTKADTTAQIIVNANGSLQLTERIYINANYSNFGARNVYENYANSVQQVTQSIGIYPSLLIGEGKKQSLSMSVSRDAFTDYNIDSARVKTVESTSAGFNYQITTAKKTGFSLGTNVFQSGLPGSEFTQLNTTLGLRQAFYKNRLQLMAQFQYSQSRRVSYRPTELYGLTLNASLRLSKKAVMTLQVNGRQQSVPTLSGAREVQLLMIRHSLQFRF
jgi:hypothetical protein